MLLPGLARLPPPSSCAFLPARCPDACPRRPDASLTSPTAPPLQAPQRPDLPRRPSAPTLLLDNPPSQRAPFRIRRASLAGPNMPPFDRPLPGHKPSAQPRPMPASALANDDAPSRRLAAPTHALSGTETPPFRWSSPDQESSAQPHPMPTHALASPAATTPYSN